MAVRVNILSPSLRKFAGDQEVVKANGETIGACLDYLARQFPGIEKALFDKHGQLLNYVHFFINGKGAYPTDLSKSVKEGDELTISFLLPGG